MRIYPAQFAPLSMAYSMPGMLSYPDRCVRYMPEWVQHPLCPPSATLGYMLTNLYPGGMSN